MKSSRGKSVKKRSATDINANKLRLRNKGSRKQKSTDRSVNMQNLKG